MQLTSDEINRIADKYHDLHCAKGFEHDNQYSADYHRREIDLRCVKHVLDAIEEFGLVIA